MSRWSQAIIYRCRGFITADMMSHSYPTQPALIYVAQHNQNVLLNEPNLFFGGGCYQVLFINAFILVFLLCCY